MAQPQLSQSLLNTKPDPSAGLWTSVIILAISGISLWFLRIPESDQYLWVSSRSSSFADGHWFQILISPLIHADPAHAISNLFALGPYFFFALSYFTTKIKTSPLSLLMTWYLLTVTTQVLSLMSFGPQIKLLGVSGGVFVILGFWLSCYFLTAKNYSFRGRFLRSSGVSLLTLVPATFEPQVSYRTHWIGFTIGILWGIGFYYFHQTNIRSYDVIAPNTDALEKDLVVESEEQKID